jgi:hypothetical protein
VFLRNWAGVLGFAPGSEDETVQSAFLFLHLHILFFFVQISYNTPV